jgi:hypothetical protein
MTYILIKKQVGGLRVFSLVRGGSEVKCLRTTALWYVNVKVLEYVKYISPARLH